MTRPKGSKIVSAQSIISGVAFKEEYYQKQFLALAERIGDAELEMMYAQYEKYLLENSSGEIPKAKKGTRRSVAQQVFLIGRSSLQGKTEEEKKTAYNPSAYKSQLTNDAVEPLENKGQLASLYMVSPDGDFESDIARQDGVIANEALVQKGYSKEIDILNLQNLIAFGAKPEYKKQVFAILLLANSVDKGAKVDSLYKYHHDLELYQKALPFLREECAVKVLKAIEHLVDKIADYKKRHEEETEKEESEKKIWEEYRESKKDFDKDEESKKKHEESKRKYEENEKKKENSKEETSVRKSLLTPEMAAKQVISNLKLCKAFSRSKHKKQKIMRIITPSNGDKILYNKDAIPYITEYIIAQKGKTANFDGLADYIKARQEERILRYDQDCTTSPKQLTAAQVINAIIKSDQYPAIRSRWGFLSKFSDNRKKLSSIIKQEEFPYQEKDVELIIECLRNPKNPKNPNFLEIRKMLKEAHSLEVSDRDYSVVESKAKVDKKEPKSKPEMKISPDKNQEEKSAKPSVRTKLKSWANLSNKQNPSKTR